jgi:hypothetical protein
MRRRHGRRIRVSLMAIIIGAVVLVGAGAAAATWRTSQHQRQHQATLALATCGSAITHFLTADTQILSADRGALTCFVLAARHCRPASLQVTVMGTDTGTQYLFRIDPGSSSCRVTEQRQDYSANFGGSRGQVTTLPCRLIAVSITGVMLESGGREVLIPATVTVPSPT